MNPNRSVLSSASFSFGPDTPVLFKTAFDHYRIGTPASLMSLDRYGDENGLLIGDEQVQSWAQLPTMDDPRWQITKKPYDEALLVLYRDHDGDYRYIVEYRVFKLVSPAGKMRHPPCCGWMCAEDVFQRNSLSTARYANVNPLAKQRSQ